MDVTEEIYRWLIRSEYTRTTVDQVREIFWDYAPDEITKGLSTLLREELIVWTSDVDDTEDDVLSLTLNQ